MATKYKRLKVWLPKQWVESGSEVEGTDVLSTGEAGGTKFLREDGDGTCSWQTAGGSFAGDMDDITDGSTYVKTHNDFTDALESKLNGIAEGAEVNVQADWNQATDTSDDYIKNKPTSFGLTQPQIMARSLGC